MDTRINIIAAIILIVTGAIAVGCYEARLEVGSKRPSTWDIYEAFIIIPIIFGIIVLLVTCLEKLEKFRVVTFLIYKLAAILLFTGIFKFAGELGEIGIWVNVPGEWIASIVFAGLALIAAIVGTVAPWQPWKKTLQMKISNLAQS